jgi:hypothetical protein
MKTHPIVSLSSTPAPLRLLGRLVTSAFALLLLTMTVSCGVGNPEEHEAVMQALSAVAALEVRVHDLQQQITDTEVLSSRVSFWQSVAAVFVVISIVALVGGSALGSRARRENVDIRQMRLDVAYPEPPVSPVALESLKSPQTLKSPTRSLNHA